MAFLICGEVFATLWQYIPAVLREVWGLGFGLVAGIIGAVALTVAHVSVPWWGWVLIGFACLSPAQFLAYHRLRERGQTIADRSATSVTNNYYFTLSGGSALPPPEPPQLEQGDN